jgi:hypothetical protein
MTGPHASPNRASIATSASWRFALFAPMWALATLCHVTNLAAGGLPEPLLAIPAVAFLLKPRSVPTFVVFVTLQAIEILVFQPCVGSHWLFSLFVALAILLTWSRLAFADGIHVDPGRLVDGFAPAVRLSLCLLYFYAVLHKLNWSFLDPSVSCAAAFPMSIWPNRIFGAACAWSTLAVEMAIPLLLMWRRSRAFGLMLALGFHLVLSLAFYVGFASMLFAVFSLFLPDNTPELVENWWARSSLRERRAVTVVRAFAARWSPRGRAALYSAVIVMAIASRLARPLWFAVFLLLYLIWAVTGAILVRTYAAAIFPLRRRFQYAHGFWKSSFALLYVVPILMLVNGASPYLGLKTESTFSMFSNLRTEGGVTNHLFIPESWQLANFQRDVVTLVESSDPRMNHLIGHEVPLVELRSLIAGRPFEGLGVRSFYRPTEARPRTSRLVYVRNGSRVVVDDVASDLELSTPPPFWLRQVLAFHIVRPAPYRCGGPS